MVETKSVLSTIGAVAAAAVVMRSIIDDFLPYEIRDYLLSYLHSIFSRRFSSEITMIIEDIVGPKTNEIFEAAQLYIGAHTKITSSSSTIPTRLKVRKPDKQLLLSVHQNEEFVDEFQGIEFRWMLHYQHVDESFLRGFRYRFKRMTSRSHAYFFHLTFNKKYIDIVIEKYLPHILKELELHKQETKTIKLCTINNPENLSYCDFPEVWESISLNHPATFETLAMDSGLKEMILEDLEKFLRRKEFYRRVGKAWKRGYLLYGSPGTGKSSLIAAMANYLNFDVYDLQLNGIKYYFDLRKALLSTANKSITVVEDIDCCIKFNDTDDDGVGDGDGDGGPIKKVTLSGLLNFIDGLWSSCGDERIFIFTTNHKDKLDPALLRSGRMDLHIHMSYCTPCGFKVLAKNYLGINHHELFSDVENLIRETNVTPAEVAQQLMKHNAADLKLKGLIKFIMQKKEVNNAREKAKKLEDESE